MTKYKYVNAFNDDHFPGGWDDDDIEWFAEFLRAETKYRLVRRLDNEDYAYRLLRKVDDD